MDETGLAFDPFVPAWLAAAAIVMAAAGVWAAYRRTTRPVAGRVRAVTLGLRIAAVLVLGACLLRPSLETTHYEVSKRPLLVLVDRSDSMSFITDTPTGESRLEAIREALARHDSELRGLEERYEVVRGEFAKGLLTGRSERSSVRGGGGEETRYSAYGLALEQGFTHLTGGQCDAVLLFGDGSHNCGPPDPVDVAATMAQQGVPILTVGVGQDAATAQLRDIRVVEFSSPRTAWLFSAFSVRARVLCRGCQGREVSVEFTFPGLPVQQRSAKVSHAAEVVPFEFEVVPEAQGEYKLTLTAAPVPGELLEANNGAATFVKVMSTGVTAGYYDTLRPESKFVARALTGAPQLQVRRTLVLEGTRVPDAQERMEAYDVVVLGDIAPSAFRPSRLLALKRGVHSDGKGLVLLAGRASLGEGGWQETVIGDLLPVTVPAPPGRAPGPHRLLPRAEHVGHPVLASAAEAEGVAVAWAAVPPLAGVLTGVEPKRGASVLAEDEDGHPLVVVHRSGAGRVVCVLADTTFRWAFTESDTQAQHKAFWRQLVTWASGIDTASKEEVRLELSKQAVLVEETVGIRVVVTEGGEPVGDARVRLEVRGPDGEAEEVPTAFARTAGAYVADYRPVRPGDYVVEAVALRSTGEVGEDRDLFCVTDANPELEDPVADLDLLRTVAAATEAVGGRYFPYHQVGEALRVLLDASRPLALTTRRRSDVWDAWPVFAAVSACVVAEWVVRKRAGLV
jgi:uncharacterized membrane protein